MKEILLINPGNKKKPVKKGKKMAKRKASKKRAKSNPRRTSIRKTTRRAASSIRKSFMGLNVGSALKDIPAFQAGMFAAKFAAKKFGDNRATETDPESWSWDSYLKGAFGAIAAGIIAQKIKPGSGQNVLRGGLNLMIFKLIENEWIPKSEFATAHFGQDDELPGYVLGEVYENEEGTPYMLGEDGEWAPADDRHRLPEDAEAMMGGYDDDDDELLGDELQPPGRLGGNDLEPVGPLGADPYAEAFFGNA